MLGTAKVGVGTGPNRCLALLTCAPQYSMAMVHTGCDLMTTVLQHTVHGTSRWVETWCP